MKNNPKQELADLVRLANDYMASAEVNWRIGILKCKGEVKGLTRICIESKVYVGVILKGKDIPAMVRYVSVLCSFFKRH